MHRMLLGWSTDAWGSWCEGWVILLPHFSVLTGILYPVPPSVHLTDWTIAVVCTLCYTEIHPRFSQHLTRF